MGDYIGKICPFCKTEIKEGEEVKVCPACDVPHHASCWEENKGCATFGCSEKHCEVQETNPTDVCSNCGATLSDGQMFCHKCGTPKAAVKRNVCGKCGAELQEGQEFCMRCGQKAGLVVDAGVNSAISQFNLGIEKKKKKNKLLPIIIGVIGVAVVLALFFVLREFSVDELVLSESSLEMKVDDSQTISYTINPERAANASVKWESSNENVAVVSNGGEITAKGEGSCAVTATARGKSATLTITVKSGPDFAAIYNEYCDSSWAYVSSDGSYMTVDTNPNNQDDYTNYSAYLALYSINTALGLPDSLFEKMGQTRALDGRQSSTYDDITVSWTYHPDHGLEVMYEAN